MVSEFSKATLDDYVKMLSQQEPVPGGGSAACLLAAMGAALISMVARYSSSRQKTKKEKKMLNKILATSEKHRKRLLKLVTADAKAYEQFAKLKNTSGNKRRKAQIKAIKVPLEACRLCYELVDLTPYLVQRGSLYLISDVQVACEFLLAAYNASLTNVRVNQ